MITLGNTLKQTFSMFGNEGLTYNQWSAFVVYLKDTFIEMGCDEGDNETDYLELFGGYFKVVEDIREDFRAMLLDACEDIRIEKSPEDKSRGFDFVFHLIEDDLYIVGVCTNNQGGNHYIITGDLIKKYPSIKSHLNTPEVY